MGKLPVKICCISSIQEANLAVNAGATAIGLVGPMPSGPGIISNDQIALIAREFKDRVNTFLLTSETQADKIILHARKTTTNTIQLVDKVEPEELQIVRDSLPGIRLIQVIHVLGEESITGAHAIQSLVDGLLLDSGNPKAAIKTLGGTGITHNWSVSREIVTSVDVPVYLAGGLNAQNVTEAIQKVRPYGVDLCSGVRTNGHLDVRKLTAFMKAVSSRED